MTISGAYGRDYKSKAEILTAWMEDKDFQIHPQGSYINKADAENQGIHSFSVRYKEFRSQCILSKKEKGWKID